MKRSSRFLLAFLLLLTGCSSQRTPDFTASGYLADRGAVRIWRKEHSQRTTHLQTVYTPFNEPLTETTDYQWQQGKLIAIERHIDGDHAESVTLRFDQDGQLSFMQRQLENRREALSADAIALYQFDAGRMLTISNDLLKGRVRLLQGRWIAPDRVTLCSGKNASPELDDNAVRYITQHQQGSGKPLSIAWLEAPGGTQLLLATPKALCATEPEADSF